jgi:dipeptidyl aminopeptidase/acylaminoacyl peptidase
VDYVQKPVLILHGLEDDIVPPEASEEWVEALRRAGKTFEYKTYPGEPHGFLKRANLLDVWSRVERFLDWYLLP